MSTVEEIESAIETLPPEQVDAVFQWLQTRKDKLVSPATESARKHGGKPFMKLAGCLEGPEDLSERKGFAAK